MPKGNTKKEQQFDRQEVKVISIEHNRMQIELEIDRHVKSIQSLISKLRPFERQKYFNGLLLHLLAEPDPVNASAVTKKPIDADYSKLGPHDLELLRELSQKMEQLYVIMGDDDLQ